MITQLDSKKLSEWLHLAEIIAETVASRAIESSLVNKQNQAQRKKDKQISFDRGNLKYGNLAIPMHSRPMTSSLIGSFFEVSDEFLTKEEMMKKVYKYDQRQSLRMKHSMHQNLLKLISRSRQFLERACPISESGQTISWLPFDKKLKGYHLYQVSSS